MEMAPTELSCRVNVKAVENNDSGREKSQGKKTLPLSDCSDVGTDVRTRWANEVMKHFAQIEKPHTSVRAWDFIAGLDGSIEPLPTPALQGDLIQYYPVRFQIPLSTLRGLDREEKVRRVEKFAMASLIYEIMTGRKPFEDLTDDEVRHRFTNGEIPDDAAALPYGLFILSGWSTEFSQELARRVEVQQEVSLFQDPIKYAKSHPLQVVGAALSAVSFCAVPLLGAVGFTAAGPAAGSAAAAWQSSMGVVKAGSLFSWCQSAAMGGGALGGIQAAGVAGNVLARAGNLPELVETFRRGFRTPNRGAAF